MNSAFAHGVDHLSLLTKICVFMALACLLAAIYHVATMPQTMREILVLDPQTGHIYQPQHGVGEASCREVALREAVALRLRLGVYHYQPPEVLRPRIAAYWFDEKVEPGFSAMNTADWVIERVVFRGNFAKIYLYQVNHFIQINFWEIRRTPSPLNPLGYQFRAKITLMSDRGLSL